ncbi:MAG TPA: hypothetical protein VEO95_10965 [Chthoniobacteraceae bacterium]|nr:hypothetical protein [Chthoniobacteraceae bacterium]
MESPLNSTATGRELFAREALAQIPKILTLQDRNAHSPTYGCFDRNFWHYKIIDFPSGMAAEFVWPLALVYSLPIAGNSYFHQPAIKQWAEAGMIYAARSAHADGSCDDYFPFEKAAGAAAFSLLACIESYTLLKLKNQELLDFFARRADWLARHHESGRLTNHQALIVLCLEKVARLFESNRWDKLKAKRLKRVLDWQDDEGWFQEYEGCDPGYHTLTIGLLAQLHALAPGDALKTALEKAIRFAAHFVHPDGSFGGEYTSRNTYNFFPHGFEIAGTWLPEARAINDRFLAGLANGLGSCYADDHIVGHHTWSYLLAYHHWNAERPPAPEFPEGRVHFQNAGIVIDRRGPAVLYLALNKGGVFKLFVNGRLAHSDTQLSVQVEEGRTRTAVAHLVGKYRVEIGDDQITISGKLGWAKTKQMTTFNLVVLRALMFTVGRFFPNLIRKLLQRILITGKKSAPLQFKRTLGWQHDQLAVADELTAASWEKVRAVGIGAAQTSIYVVMSRTWQAGQLQPWLDLTPQVRGLKQGEPLRVERTL